MDHLILYIKILVKFRGDSLGSLGIEFSTEPPT